MKSESNFIKELENKAVEQHKLAQTQMIPDWAKGIASWLAINPWRVLVPISVLVYGIWRLVYGEESRELILGLFGGFVR